MITLHSLFLFYNNYGLILRHRLHLPSYYGTHSERRRLLPAFQSIFRLLHAVRLSLLSSRLEYGQISYL